MYMGLMWVYLDGGCRGNIILIIVTFLDFEGEGRIVVSRSGMSSILEGLTLPQNQKLCKAKIGFFF